MGGLLLDISLYCMLLVRVTQDPLLEEAIEVGTPLEVRSPHLRWHSALTWVLC